MATVNKKYTLGWLGSYDEGNCDKFDLSQSQNGSPIKDQILYVIQKSHDGAGPIVYTPGSDNMAWNGFNELACGYMYEIVLQDGAAGFDIPGFVASNFYSDSGSQSPNSQPVSGYINSDPLNGNLQSITVSQD